jgi:F420-non-reducing hydrogenase small subunit
MPAMLLNEEAVAAKPKLAVYWAASCGGCEIAIANLHEKILEVVQAFDFMFCPCLMDTKRADILALADGEITATLFNGAIRTEENEEMARLLRAKSQLLISYGSCACTGGIPALSNLHPRLAHLESSYLTSPTVDNPEGVIPREKTEVPEGTLTLPRYYGRVRSLGQVVPVDYSIPGCPPETEQVWNVLQVFLRGDPLPPRGAVLGAGHASVCEECGRHRTEKKVKQFHRIWELIPDRDQCLLEQGVLCMGSATRDGCGGRCPEVNMPCTGCYGPPEGVHDQGAKMASTLGSIVDIAPIRELKEGAEMDARVKEVMDGVVDPAGLGNKYSLSSTLQKRTAQEGVE